MSDELAKLFDSSCGATQGQANERQRRVREDAAKHCNGNLEEFFPPTVLSYAIGRRAIDGDRAGPGLIWASALQLVLDNCDIPTYSGLTLPNGPNSMVFLLRLKQRGKKVGKVLLVMLTKALYQPEACLKEINTAKDVGVKIIPLRFETNLPKQADQ